MLRSDLIRKIALCLTAAVFIIIAIRAVMAPEKMAAGLGYTLNGANGYSEFHAIYFGVWIATAILALLAANRIREPLFGDLVALFVLAQPAGRLIGLAKSGWPHGFLLAMFAIETAGGMALLAIRPARS